VYESSSAAEGAVGVKQPLIRRRRRARRRVVSPSERFIWAMVLLLIALVGTIMLEAVYIIVTKNISDELVAGISALVGSLATAFLMGKRSAWVP